MTESFAKIFESGGKANSLGRSNEVLEIVLNDKSRLDELYNCISEENAWVRMRAIDTFEKICRVHPDWIENYTEKILTELTPSSQASIQWHLAQIFQQINLNNDQREKVINWIVNLLSQKEIDWIASANLMENLAYFTRKSLFLREDLISLLNIQQGHKSKSVVKRAGKLLEEFK